MTSKGSAHGTCTQSNAGLLPDSKQRYRAACRHYGWPVAAQRWVDGEDQGEVRRKAAFERLGTRAAAAEPPTRATQRPIYGVERLLSNGPNGSFSIVRGPNLQDAG
jgi:hypothetical protein